MKLKALIPVLIGSALLCGAVFAGPQFLIRKAVEGRGLTYLASQYTTETNELEMDFPRAREIYDGHFPPSELFSAPFGPSILNPLPVLLLAVPIWLTGGEINSAYILNQFLFGSILFFVFFFLGLVITHKFWWAYFFGFVGALTPLARYLPRAVSGFDYFLDLAVKNFYPLVNSPLELLFLHKSVDPLITFLVYLPAIALLIRFWTRPSKRLAVVAALVTGLLFYTYWHYWVYLVMVWIWLGAYAFWKRKESPERFRWMTIFAAVLALVAVPYFANYFIFNNGGAAETVVARYGVIEYGRYAQLMPILADYIFYAITALLVYLIFWRNKERESRNMAILLWALNLAAVCVWNIQILSGFTLSANHWWLAYAPVGLLILFSLVYAVSEATIRNKRTLAIILMVLAALLVVKKVVNVAIFISPAEKVIEKYSFNPGIAAAWDWLNKNVEKEPGVISPVIMDSVYLTIYTSSRPYLPFYTNTLISDLDMEQRFLNSQKLFGVSRENLEKELRWRSVPSGCGAMAEYFSSRSLVCDNHTRFSFENGRFLYGFEYLTRGYSTVGNHKPNWDIPEEKIQDLLNQYDKLKVSFKAVDSDYVFYSQWSKNLNEINLKSNKDLELVYENDASQIYRIKH